MLRVDLHVHSQFSKDARGSILQLAQAARNAGLDGFAVTDHDTVDGHRHIDDAMEATGIQIIPGVEVTSLAGHIVALGVTRAPPKGQTLAATVGNIREQGGIAVAAHPFRMWTGIGPTDLQEGFDAGLISHMEGANARDRRILRDNIQRHGSELGIPMTGGSDAHTPEELGLAWTEVDAKPSVKAILAAIKAGKCGPAGGYLGQKRVWKHRFNMLTGRF